MKWGLTSRSRLLHLNSEELACVRVWGVGCGVCVVCGVWGVWGVVG